MDFEYLRIDREGNVATITLNRPDRLNALDRHLTRELHLALDELGHEFPEIRALIITGEGRGFCSGADVGAMDSGEESGSGARRPYDPLTSIIQLAPHIRRTPQPVIAAVNGIAAGAGLAIALASDIRIASEQARFASIFVKRALAPDTGTSVSLPDLVGFGIAAELAYTGRVVDAHFALEHKLVNRVVAPDRLLDEANALAQEIAANPPLTIRSTKTLLYRRQSLEEALPFEVEANQPSRGSADAVEAVRSFLEKRPPVFHGR